MSSISFQHIGLRPEQWKAVKKKARHAGTTTSEYVKLLIERDLSVGPAFDEILSPVREDFKRNGISEKQLDEILKKASRTRKARS